jgi:ADP-ribose pyrophosphatase YjhB (NUDIX family)
MAWYHRVAGGIAHRVWRITRPRTLGVRAILLDQAHRVALVRHTYTDHWYLPGGGVKKGESTLAAIRRELREEIAIENVRIANVLGVYHSMREGKDDHVIVYVVRAPGDALRGADALEVAEVGWFAPDALPAEPAVRHRQRGSLHDKQCSNLAGVRSGIANGQRCNHASQCSRSCSRTLQYRGRSSGESGGDSKRKLR